MQLRRPEIETNLPPNRSEERNPDGEPGKLLVLVAFDEEPARKMAATLRRCGHEVRMAFDGPTALRAAQEGRPDVILLESGLPGMDGYEVARRLYPQSPRERRPLLIALTGSSGEENRRRPNEPGIDLHLVKPVDPKVLCLVLNRFHRLLKS